MSGAAPGLPLIILRPEPGAAATLAAARALGLEAHSFALFAVAPRAWVVPDPASIDALLIGSSNAPRHAGPSLKHFADTPTYAVGAASAAAARDAGLTVVATGKGGMQALLAMLAPEHRRLLRLTGRERVPLTLPAGVMLTERVVYASQPVAMPGPLTLLLTARALPGAVVMLHAALAARHFARECARAKVARHRLKLAAISARVAEATDIDAGWAMVSIAPQPNDTALLALARQMCQSPLAG